MMKEEKKKNKESVKKKRGRPRKVATRSQPQRNVYPKLDPSIFVEPHQNTHKLPPHNAIQFEVSKVGCNFPSNEKPAEKSNDKDNYGDGKVKRQFAKGRDKGTHNAEEKRRKAKINSWIIKLGELLCRLPAQRKSKSYVLERAFQYINSKEKEDISQKLLLRIKDLEIVIMKLVELLRQHSVSIPDNIAGTRHSSSLPKQILIALPLQHCSSNTSKNVNNTPCSTSISNHVSLSNSVGTELPNLSVHTAKNKTTNECCKAAIGTDNDNNTKNHRDPIAVDAFAVIDDNNPQQNKKEAIVELKKILGRPVSSLLPLSCIQEAATNTQLTAVSSFMQYVTTVGSTSLVSSVITSSNAASITPDTSIVSTGQLRLLCTTKTVNSSHRLQPHHCNTENNKAHKPKMRNVDANIKCSVKVTSPVQRFGIDNLLVNNISVTSNVVESVQKKRSTNVGTSVVYSTPFSVYASVVNNTNESICVSTFTSTTCSQRPRLSSNGHTVAAMLETNPADCIVRSKIISSAYVKPAKTENRTGHSSKEVVLNNAPPASVASSKRWGNVIENAHNSDMLLTSFVLDSKTAHKCKPKRIERLATKDKEKITGVLKPLSSTTKKLPVCDSGNNFMTTVNLNSLNKQAGTTWKNIVSMDCITSADSVTPPVTTVANVGTPNDTDVVCASETTPTVSLTSPNSSINPTLSTHISPRHIQSGHTSPCNQGDYARRQTSKNAVLQIDVISSSIAPNVSSVQCQTDTVFTRTMKDRSVKNKWLNIEKKQIEISTTSSVSHGLESPNEQCSSPVISFPNIGRSRKRSACHLNKELRIKRKDTSCASDFSAESLSRPASKNPNLKNSFKNETKQAQNKHPMKGKQYSRMNLQQQQRSGQKLNHQPELPFPTSLPTILNIFAPAPVPTTNIQHHNMQAGFSNFSAEALINNTCNVNMMSNNIPEENFHDNMLLAANFTNFSADTLIAGQESNYAVDNLIAQNNVNNMSNYWNQWMPQEIALNEHMFQNMSNLQNSMQRHRQNITTDCSPIKSIMSILQSSPSNNADMPLHNLNNLQHREHRFDHRNKRISNPSQNNLNSNIWNKQAYPPNNIFQMNNEQANESTMFSNFNQVGNINCNSTTKHFSNANLYKSETRSIKEKCGPSYGSYSLVNSST